MTLEQYLASRSDVSYVRTTFGMTRIAFNGVPLGLGRVHSLSDFYVVECGAGWCHLKPRATPLVSDTRHAYATELDRVLELMDALSNAITPSIGDPDILLSDVAELKQVRRTLQKLVAQLTDDDMDLNELCAEMAPAFADAIKRATNG